jgi:hypothetical protein
LVVVAVALVVVLHRYKEPVDLLVNSLVSAQLVEVVVEVEKVEVV